MYWPWVYHNEWYSSCPDKALCSVIVRSWSLNMAILCLSYSCPGSWTHTMENHGHVWNYHDLVQALVTTILWLNFNWTTLTNPSWSAYFKTSSRTYFLAIYPLTFIFSFWLTLDRHISLLILTSFNSNFSWNNYINITKRHKTNITITQIDITWHIEQLW